MISITNNGVDIPVGEQINNKGVIIEAHSSPEYDCSGCFFERWCERELPCCDTERLDKKHVIFKKA